MVTSVVLEADHLVVAVCVIGHRDDLTWKGCDCVSQVDRIEEDLYSRMRLNVTRSVNYVSNHSDLIGSMNSNLAFANIQSHPGQPVAAHKVHKACNHGSEVALAKARDIGEWLVKERLQVRERLTYY